MPKDEDQWVLTLGHGVAYELGEMGVLVPLISNFIEARPVPALQGAVELDAEFARVFYRLHLAVEEKRFKDALELIDDCNDNDQFLVLKAKALMGLSRYPEAISYLFRAKKIQTTKETAYLIGHCFRKMKEFDLAISVHKKTVAALPEYPKPFQDLTLIYEEMGNLAEALRFGEIASQIIPGNTGHRAAMERVQQKIVIQSSLKKAR